MITVTINTTEYTMPGSWEEMTTQEYLHCIAAQQVEVTDANFDEQIAEVKMRLLKKLLNIPWWDFLGWKWNRFFVKQEIVPERWWILEWHEELLPLVDYVFMGEKTFTKNLIPTFKYKGVTFYGPSDRLTNVIGHEAEISEYLYSIYREKNNTDALNMFIGCLYRRRDKQASVDALVYERGDARIAFNENRVEQDGKFLSGLNENIKQGIIFWWENCKRSYQEQYSDVFSGGSASEVDYEHFRKLLRMLSGEKRGTVSEVKKMPLHEIYFELSELNRERLEMEKQFKQ